MSLLIQIYKLSVICSVYRNHYPVLSSFMTFHWDRIRSNTMCATSGAGTVYLFAATHKWGQCCSIFCFLFSALFIIVFRFFSFRSLYCPSFVDLWLLITHLVSSNFLSNVTFKTIQNFITLSRLSFIIRRKRFTIKPSPLKRLSHVTPGLAGVDFFENCV